HWPHGLRTARPVAIEIDLFLELLLELPGHGARPADPAADLAHDARQLLRTQHDERQDEDDQDLGEPDIEHGRFRPERRGNGRLGGTAEVRLRAARARTLCPRSPEDQTPRSVLAAASALGVTFASGNSASGASERICRRDAAVSS